MPRNVISKNEGVSPVIGTILLVALTVFLVGIIGAVLMGFGMPEPAPIVGISIGSQGNTITVTQLNGSVLPAGSYTILVDGVDKTAEFGGEVDFGPGVTLSWDSGSEAVGTVSVVYTSDKGVSTLLAQRRIGKAGSGSTDFSTITVGGNTYQIPEFKGDWITVVNTTKNSAATQYLLEKNSTYQYGNECWIVVNIGTWLSKTEAISDPTPAEYNSLHTGSLVKLNTDTVLTQANVVDTKYYPASTFVYFDNSYPMGTLFANNSNLYAYVSSDSTAHFELGINGVGTWSCRIIGTTH